MPSRRPPRAALALTLVSGLAGGCHYAPARVWNLREVHQPSGRPDRVARTRSDVAYLLQVAFEQLDIGQNLALEGEERRLDDPLGVCLENLLALERTDAGDPVDQPFQAEGFAWLAVDCTYGLSREAAVRGLRPLAAELGVTEPVTVDPEAAATPAEIDAAFEDLVTAARPIVRGEGGSALDVRSSVEAIGALLPDRAGTLRLLRATNVLMERARGRAALEPVAALQRSLARRAVGLALEEVLADPEGLVRAAGLRTRLELAAPEQADELLVWALEDPHEDVARAEEVQRTAVAWIAERGLPRSAGGPRALGDYELRWCERLTRLLAERRGPEAVGAAGALARITGRPATIRPEAWLAWWRWERPGAQEAGS